MDFQTFKRSAASSVLLAMLSGAMLLGVPKAFADDHGDCQRRVEKAELRVDDAVRKHGPASHEAEERRRDLNAERDRCWQRYHGWWSARDQRWHTERDWDRDDHDHDHDDHH